MTRIRSLVSRFLAWLHPVEVNVTLVITATGTEETRVVADRVARHVATVFTQHGPRAI